MALPEQQRSRPMRTLLRTLNAKDYVGATEIDKWDMTDGKPMAGLLRRRQAEAALFQKV
jgi:lysozyme